MATGQILTGNEIMAQDLLDELAALGGGKPLLTGYRGSVNVVFVANNDVGVTVVFPAPFAANPFVVCQIATGIGGTVGAVIRVTGLSASQFTLNVHLAGASSLTVPVHWHAIA